MCDRVKRSLLTCPTGSRTNRTPNFITRFKYIEQFWAICADCHFFFNSFVDEIQAKVEIRTFNQDTEKFIFLEFFSPEPLNLTTYMNVARHFEHFLPTDIFRLNESFLGYQAKKSKLTITYTLKHNFFEIFSPEPPIFIRYIGISTNSE